MINRCCFLQNDIDEEKHDEGTVYTSFKSNLC